jgi:hypothetical protein
MRCKAKIGSKAERTRQHVSISNRSSTPQRAARGFFNSLIGVDEMNQRMTWLPASIIASALFAAEPAAAQETAARDEIAEQAAAGAPPPELAAGEGVAGEGAAADSGASRDDDRAIAFELGTGAQYDSNVAVLELDTSSNAGDAAALLEFGVGYTKPRTGALGLQVGYNLSQTLHEDFDAFDIRIHRGSAGLSYDLEKVDAGATFQYAHAELDGDEFLVLTQVSPFVSKLLGKRLFLRFAYADTDKDFATNPGRDARADALSSDMFVFLNGLETYLVLGVRYDDEDAVDGQFDYTGHRLRAQLSQRFALGARRLTLKAQLRYETRDYAEPTLSIGERRNDDRYQLEVTAQLPIGERVSATFGYKHADNRSNLSSVDFDENVYSVTFRAGL